MKIRIKRVDKTLPLPEYKTSGAAGFDLYSRENITIPAKEVRYVPLNVVVEVPENCWALLAARSSAHKLGIIQANGIGIGDRDFCGDGDEYHFAALNYTDKEVIIPRGTRIAQMVVVGYSQVNFEEVDSFHRDSRGGFGSTGVK